MLFSGVISLFLASLAAVSPTTASPVNHDIVKRQSTDIENVFNNLHTSMNTILPQITTLGNSGNATAENVTPYLNQLIDAFNSAQSSLAEVPPSANMNPDDTAAMLAEMISSTAEALNTLHSHHGYDHWLPAIDYLLIDIDFALKGLLLSVAFLVNGVLFLVAKLLVGVAVLLKDLSFVLIVTLLDL